MTKVTSKDVNDFLQGLTAQEKGILERLKRLLAKPETGDLRWYHAVGRTLLALHAPWAEYGAHRIACLVKALTCSRELLYRSFRFARGYSTKGLAELRRQRIAWNQVVLLLNIHDLKQRRQLQQQAAAERWSFRRLRAEIHALCGYGPSRGGRKPQLQDFGPRVALRDLVRVTQRWLDLGKQFWSGKGGPLHQLDKLPSSQRTPEMLRDLRLVSALMEEIQESAEKLRRELAARVKRLDTELKQRATP